MCFVRTTNDRDKQSNTYIRIANQCFILCTLLMAFIIDSYAIQIKSTWDTAIQDILLENVDTSTASLRSQRALQTLYSLQRTGTADEILEAERRLAETDPTPLSALEVWQKSLNDYGIRSILFIDSSIDIDGPMSFQCDECFMGDLFDSFADVYSLAWQKDPITSIHWLYPAKLKYNNIMSVSINVESDYYGLAMSSGVLNSLKALLEEYEPFPVRFHIPAIPTMPTSRSYTFNVPIDIPRGQYSLRSILNLICLGSPRITFYVRNEHPFYTEIFPVNIRSPWALTEYDETSVGIKAFWDMEVGDRLDGDGERSKVIQALTSKEARVRWAARKYLQIESKLGISERTVMGKQLSDDVAAWISLALLEIHAPFEGNAFEPMIAPALRQRVTPELLRTCRIDLAILASLELARVLDDIKGVTIVTQRDLPQEILDDIIADAARIARLSDTAWEALMNTEWGFASVAPEWVERITHGNTERQTQLAFTIMPSGAPPASALAPADGAAATQTPPMEQAAPEPTATEPVVVTPDLEVSEAPEASDAGSPGCRWLHILTVGLILALLLLLPLAVCKKKKYNA